MAEEAVASVPGLLLRVAEERRGEAAAASVERAAAARRRWFLKDKLAVPRRRDALPAEGVRSLRAAGEVPAARRGVRDGERLPIVGSVRRGSGGAAPSDDLLHLAFELRGLEVGGELELTEIRHLAADVLERLAVIGDPPLAHLQHHLHLHRRRERGEHLGVDVVRLGDEHLLLLGLLLGRRGRAARLPRRILLPLILLLVQERHGAHRRLARALALAVRVVRQVHRAVRARRAGAARPGGGVRVERLVQHGGFHRVEQELLGGAPDLPLLVLAQAASCGCRATLQRGGGAVEDEHGHDAVVKKPTYTAVEADEMRVGEHVASVVSHGFDELEQPDGRVHGDALARERLDRHPSTCWL